MTTIIKAKLKKSDDQTNMLTNIKWLHTLQNIIIDQNYRNATLSTFYLIVLEITILSLKPIGQYSNIPN